MGEEYEAVTVLKFGSDGEGINLAGEPDCRPQFRADFGCGGIEATTTRWVSSSQK